MLPETDVARVRRWVFEDRNGRLPERAQGLIRCELDVVDRHVTLYECRPPGPEFGPEWTRFPIVRFHDTKARREWAIYSARPQSPISPL